jgi:hypothetical protein
MSIETTIEQAELDLAAPPTTDTKDTNSAREVSIRSGWVFGMFGAVLLLAYLLVGWVHDFQRIRSLEAEPSPPSKVITKTQAWQQIYSRSAR